MGSWRCWLGDEGSGKEAKSYIVVVLREVLWGRDGSCANSGQKAHNGAVP